MRRGLRAAALIAALLAPLSGAGADDLKPFGRGSWKVLRGSYDQRPLIVHFWGLACGPCRKELANWGELLADVPDLPLVTINADIVPDPPGAAADFLDKAGLSRAENWIFDDSFAERLRYEIDPSWQGEIPVTWLIGRDGAVRKIDGAAQMQEVRAWAAEAMKAQ